MCAFNPGVTDISGQLRAQGSTALGQGIAQGFQDYQRNKFLTGQSTAKWEAAVRANPEILKVLEDPQNAPADAAKAFGKLHKDGAVGLKDAAVLAQFADSYVSQKQDAMKMQAAQMQMQAAQRAQAEAQQRNAMLDKIGQFLNRPQGAAPSPDVAQMQGLLQNNPFMATAAQLRQAGMSPEEAAKLMQAQGQGSGAPVMALPDVVKQFPQDQYDATMVPTGQPGMVQVKSVSPRAPAQGKITPVTAGNSVLMVDEKGKVVGRESVEPATPAGYQKDAKGGIVPIPGSEAELQARAVAEKEKTNMRQQMAQIDVMANAVSEVLPKIDMKTAGPIGGFLLSAVPGTDAYDLAAKLDTLKANIGFKQLSDMRAASPTGGALGQVAVRELEFLQAALGNLNPAQSPKQLKDNVEKIQTHLGNWKKTLEGVNPDEKAEKAETKAVGKSVAEDILSKYGVK